jgi:hypothetical protein
MHDGKAEKIRFYGVDCPEKRQAFGQKAKQFTSDAVFGKTVNVDPVTTDRYGRTVGLVYIDGKCLNEQLIKSGFAWLYKQYCDKPMCKDWQKLEQAARVSKVGLWSMPNPVAPWEFRHPGKKISSSQDASSQLSGAYHGNTSSRVFHSSSCEHYNCRDSTEMFGNRDEAIRAGYTPCGRCRP